jgi:hypothetical protein
VAGIDLERALAVDEPKDTVGGLLHMVDVREANDIPPHLLPQPGRIVLQLLDRLGR